MSSADDNSLSPVAPRPEDISDDSADVAIVTPDDEDDDGSYVTDALDLVSDDVKDRATGEELLIPEGLAGANVLDLGSGAGLVSFILSKLVGEKGSVTGIDSSEEQVKFAQDQVAYHTEKFGYKSANVTFVQGEVEKLAEAGLKEGAYDVIVSNNVFSRCQDKSSALSEAYKVLKEGGELYFADVYANGALSDEVKQNKALVDSGFGGALVWDDLHSLAEKVGLSSPRLVSSSLVIIDKEDVREAVGPTEFVSATYRAFRLPEVRQSACVATYEGSAPNSADELLLDRNNIFKSDEPVTVDAETATILKASRLANFFSFEAPAKKLHTDDEPVRDNPFDLADGEDKSEDEEDILDDVDEDDVVEEDGEDGEDD